MSPRPSMRRETSPTWRARPAAAATGSERSAQCAPRPGRADRGRSNWRPSSTSKALPNLTLEVMAAHGLLTNMGCNSALSACAFLSILVAGGATANAQGLSSLKRVTPPQPSNLSQYVRDPAALVVLGKALFWDMQAGSDGRTACATCHFHAGADHRAQNQLSNLTAGLTANSLLSDSDFPFHVLSNPGNNRSPVVRDSAAVAGSAGVFLRMLTEIVPGSPFESGYDLTNAPL